MIISILSDSVESLIGAIFIDGGYKAAYDFVKKFSFSLVHTLSMTKIWRFRNISENMLILALFIEAKTTKKREKMMLNHVFFLNIDL